MRLEPRLNVTITMACDCPVVANDKIIITKTGGGEIFAGVMSLADTKRLQAAIMKAVGEVNAG